MTTPISPLRLLLAAALATMLTGCYVPKETASIPNDYRKRHPIALKEGERTVEVFVGNNRGGLTPVQRAEVMSFAQTWRRESTGGVIVDLPSGTPNERAAAEALREIRSILTVSGIPPKAVSVRPYATGADKLASIRLKYSKITAQVGPCGLWPEDLGPSNTPAYQDNRPYWNFGCATQRNLAAMVENPADLVQPRGEIPAYTPRRTVVLDKYRKGESTPTTFNNDDKGKLSDIGK
ncbi:MAG: CpaD family pilus assembly protein [Pseudorhodoplanes sp.]|nr:hypothetical protein [Pseudorhodoplanes sp.]MBW7948335.1 CpaD family pilus assembly protein [Pseudorhodoplanes sp.]